MTKVLAISGSLRKDSYNTALLRAAEGLAPPGMQIEIFELAGIPLYNADDEEASGYPEEVENLRRTLAEADALLIATPEYNYSVTGVLKNAIDWASRGGPSSPLNHKPAAIMGAGGRLGTARAQMHLREILFHNQLRVVQRPEVLVDRAPTKFDEEGRLIDQRARDQIRRLLAELERTAAA